MLATLFANLATRPATRFTARFTASLVLPITALRAAFFARVSDPSWSVVTARIVHPFAFGAYVLRPEPPALVRLLP